MNPRCYACAGPVVGVADRRRSFERAWVPDCARHSETTLVGALARAAAVVTFAALALVGCGDNLRVSEPDAELPSCADLPECRDEIPTIYCTHGGECFCHGVACMAPRGEP